MWRSRTIKRCVIVLIVFGIFGHVMWQIFSRVNHGKQSHIKPTPMYKTQPISEGNTTNTNRRVKPELPILLWWDSVYTEVDEIRQCGNIKCRVTSNKRMKNHPDTSVFLFYGSNFKPYNLPLPRKSNHIWALMHEESPRNAYILSHYPALTIFNFTSTYSIRADYPITTQWLPCSDWLQDKTFMLPLVDKNRLRKLGLAPILYLQSDCDVPSDRDNFVSRLQKFIAVDSYGTCLNNKKMDAKLRFHNNMAPLDDENFFRFAARYKFTLSMENYICDDYITEKIWRPLRLGSVPVVFGAPNVWDYMPANKSAINIDDFEEIEDLAHYIHLLDTNDALYRDYLKFKDDEIENLNLKQILEQRDWTPSSCKQDRMTEEKGNYSIIKHASIFSGYECFLCNKVHEQLNSKEKVVYQAVTADYGCPSPRKFDDHGRYSIHDDTWAAEWNYGKYEAGAMLNLYHDNVVLTEKEFHRYVKKEMERTDTY